MGQPTAQRVDEVDRSRPPDVLTKSIETRPVSCWKRSGERSRLRLRKFNSRLQQLKHHLMSDRLCAGLADPAAGTDSVEGWEKGQHGPTNSHRRERNSRPGPRVRAGGWFSRADLWASAGWTDSHRVAPRSG